MVKKIPEEALHREQELGRYKDTMDQVEAGKKQAREDYEMGVIPTRKGDSFRKYKEMKLRKFEKRSPFIGSLARARNNRKKKRFTE